MNPSKRNWILLMLRNAPLDRIRVMKTLFLIWNRSGRNISGYFTFKPYLYGPCSFEAYSALNDLSSQGFIIQIPRPIQHEVRYYLTKLGRTEAEEAVHSTDLNTLKMIDSVVEEVSQLELYELLQRVYLEAPEFAINSLVREVIES